MWIDCQPHLSYLFLWYSLTVIPVSSLSFGFQHRSDVWCESLLSSSSSFRHLLSRLKLHEHALKIRGHIFLKRRVKQEGIQWNGMRETSQWNQEEEEGTMQFLWCKRRKSKRQDLTHIKSCLSRPPPSFSVFIPSFKQHRLSLQSKASHRNIIIISIIITTKSGISSSSFSLLIFIIIFGTTEILGFLDNHRKESIRSSSWETWVWRWTICPETEQMEGQTQSQQRSSCPLQQLHQESQKEINGQAKWTSWCPVSGMLLGWAMFGGFLTCVTKMEEVRISSVTLTFQCFLRVFFVISTVSGKWFDRWCITWSLAFHVISSCFFSFTFEFLLFSSVCNFLCIVFTLRWNFCEISLISQLLSWNFGVTSLLTFPFLLLFRCIPRPIPPVPHLRWDPYLLPGNIFRAVSRNRRTGCLEDMSCLQGLVLHIMTCTWKREEVDSYLGISFERMQRRVRKLLSSFFVTNDWVNTWCQTLTPSKESFLLSFLLLSWYEISQSRKTIPREGHTWKMLDKRSGQRLIFFSFLLYSHDSCLNTLTDLLYLQHLILLSVHVLGQHQRD